MTKKIEVTVSLDENQLKDLLTDAGYNDSELNIATLIGLCRNSEVMISIREQMVETLEQEANDVLSNNPEAFEDDEEQDGDSFGDSFNESYNDSCDDSYSPEYEDDDSSDDEGYF